LINGVLDARPRRIAEDAQGAIWISYYSGAVLRIDEDDRRTEFSAKDGLPGKAQLDLGKTQKLWGEVAQPHGMLVYCRHTKNPFRFRTRLPRKGPLQLSQLGSG